MLTTYFLATPRRVGTRHSPPRAVRIFFGGMYKNVCDALDSRLCGNDEGFCFWILVDGGLGNNLMPPGTRGQAPG